MDTENERIKIEDLDWSAVMDSYSKCTDTPKFTQEKFLNILDAIFTKITIIGSSKAIDKVKDYRFPPNMIVTFKKCEYLENNKIYILDGNGLNKPININYKKGENNNGNN